MREQHVFMTPANWRLWGSAELSIIIDNHLHLPKIASRKLSPLSPKHNAPNDLRLLCHRTLWTHLLRSPGDQDQDVTPGHCVLWMTGRPITLRPLIALNKSSHFRFQMKPYLLEMSTAETTWKVNSKMTYLSLFVLTNSILDPTFKGFHNDH